MRKLKTIIHIIKVLKIGLGVNSLKEIDDTLTNFYETKGVL